MMWRTFPCFLRICDLTDTSPRQEGRHQRHHTASTTAVSPLALLGLLSSFSFEKGSNGVKDSRSRQQRRRQGQPSERHTGPDLLSHGSCEAKLMTQDDENT